MKKLISISLVIVLVGVSLFFYIKNKPMEYANINQPNTLESFQKFFLELHARGLTDDVDFIGNTIPVEITDKIEQFLKIKRDQHIYKDRVIPLKDTDLSSVKYETTDTIFSIDAFLANGEEYTWTYKNVGGVWTEYNDFLFPTPEQQEAQKNKNQYQLSLYGQGSADFNVILNDKKVKEFTMSDPDGKSLSALLNVGPGKNTLVIEITPKINSDEVTYAYNIYEFPKDNPDQELIFDDTYKLFSSTPKDEKVFFAKTTKIEKLSFEINAN